MSHISEYKTQYHALLESREYLFVGHSCRIFFPTPDSDQLRTSFSHFRLIDTAICSQLFQSADYQCYFADTYTSLICEKKKLHCNRARYGISFLFIYFYDLEHRTNVVS